MNLGFVEPKKEQTQESAGAHDAQETGGENKPEGEGEEEKKEETTQETKQEEKKEEKKEEKPKASGGILPGMSEDKPHTSVKVRAPPGGKSSITF